EAIDAGVRLDGKDIVVRRESAACLARRGDFAGAVRELTIVATMAPEDPNAWRELAQAGAQNGDYTTAGPAAEETREGVLAALVKGAQKLATQLAASPADATLLSELAGWQAKLENSSAAIALYRRAVEHAPGEAQYHKQLGNLLFKTGDFAGAAKEWEIV